MKLNGVVCFDFGPVKLPGLSRNGPQPLTKRGFFLFSKKKP